jgi:DNA-binding transcriptional LysR family regulator
MTGQIPFDLASLQLLVAVAETGSLGQAAQRLSISQPAASLRLSTLERRLGLVLLERSPTGSRLTPAGVSVVDWVLPVLDAADALARGVAALRDEREERLRVASSMTVADHLVPAWLVRFHAVQPASSVALRVVNSAAVAALVRDGEADIGFVEGSSAPSGLRARTVGQDELVVVVAPGHPWARRRRPLSAAELVAAPLILREHGSGTREALERALASHGHRPTAVLELGSTTAIKAAVSAGEGAAVLSRLAVGPELADGRLVAVPTAELTLRRRFRAVWRSGRTPGGGADVLLALALRSG